MSRYYFTDYDMKACYEYICGKGFFQKLFSEIKKKNYILISCRNVLYIDVCFSLSFIIFRADILVEKVNARWQLHSEEQIIFSTACPHFIASYKTLSTSEFEELLERAGGSHGHAKLYVLPIQQLKETDCNPDTSCFEPLSEFVTETLQGYFSVVTTYPCH